MNERDLVGWLAARKGARGIGDDCAVLPGGQGQELLVTTDMLVEDVHFRRRHQAELIGHLALARGLSDIAAMGGQPRYCLVSLALARWTTEAWVKRFYAGLLELAHRHRTALVGGDLSHTGRPQLVADIVAIGECPKERIHYRSGARPGDLIYVTGALGAAGARGYEPVPFAPRVEVGRILHASACMDITDGLALDLHRLCVASKVSASLERERIPVAPGATLEQALAAGEDYELLFTAGADAPPPRSHRGVRITRIGVIREGRPKPGALELSGRPLAPRGYDHLARKRK